MVGKHVRILLHLEVYGFCFYTFIRSNKHVKLFLYIVGIVVSAGRFLAMGIGEPNFW